MVTNSLLAHGVSGLIVAALYARNVGARSFTTSERPYPAPTTEAYEISTIESPPEASCTRCDDYYDDCGNTYGGCWNTCSETSPVFTAPPCSVTPTSDDSCEISTISVPDDSACTRCDDYLDNCGNTYGGCWNTCTETPPIFTAPPCSITASETPYATPIDTESSEIGTITVPEGICVRCDDYVDDCGNILGLCWNTCTGTQPTPTILPCTPDPY